MPAGGGTPAPLTQPAHDKGEIGHIWPRALPANRGILFSILSEEGRWIAVLARDTGRWQRLVKAGGEAGYLPTGHVLYQDASALLVAPFDLIRLMPTAGPTAALEVPLSTEEAGEERLPLAVSATGIVVHASPDYLSWRGTLVWVNRSGQVSPLPLPVGRYAYPRISPDGTRIAAGAGQGQIGVFEIESGRRQRLTQSGLNFMAIWSSDGARIALTTYRAGYPNIFWMPVGSHAAPQPLVVGGDERKYPTWWSPGERALIYNVVNPTSGGDIWCQSGDQRTPFLNSRFNERLARLSPEGRWLAYVSDELGKDNVYVRPFPGPGRTTPVSTDGGTEPVWSPTGRELFYRNGPAMLAVEVSPGSPFSAGPPRRLFEGPYLGGGLLGATYDVSGDGQQFLMTVPAAAPTATTELLVIVNWFEELRAKVPVR